MNKTIATLSLVLLLAVVLFGCQSPGAWGPERDTLFQYSTLGSLMAGIFDGDMTCAELKKHGDFGLGTFNTLDGEMIVLDGRIYQVKSDGVAYAVDDKAKAPFAVVTYFAADQKFQMTEPLDCAKLKERLDTFLPTKNIPYAVKIAGRFSMVQTRSVPAQQPPYRTLPEVLKTQPTFDFQGVEGTMLGFRLPGYMDVANSPGYHLHFITADHRAGGHLLQCQVQDVTVEIDYTDQWHTALPGDSAFYNVEISTAQYK